MIKNLKEAEFAATVNNLLSQAKGMGRNNFNDLVRNRLRLQKYLLDNSADVESVFGKSLDPAMVELDNEIGKIKNLEKAIEESGVVDMTIAQIESSFRE